MPNASTTQVSSASETTGTPIPLSYGYVWATGKRAAYYMTQDTNNTHTDYWRVGMWLLGHGEWDGCNELWINDQLTWTSENDNPDQFHFHRGADSVIGSGMTPVSKGPDQGVDTFWPIFPPAIQPLHYNRIAYYSIFRKQPIENQTNDHQGDATQWTDVNPIGLWRALRTRLFDENGRMTAYAFNTNPAWHFVDVLLRRKIMVDYNIDPAKGPDDLTPAVRARFDWGSIYESAQYFDEILANGRRRFSGSYAFSSQTTLQAVLEQILLCCRSYMQEYAGKIYLVCDKPRPSIFTFSRAHILPGSWEASDRNVHTVANRFIGKFRDVLIPAASQIESITCSGHAANPMVTTQQPHPFAKGDYVVIGGTHTVYDGQWIVASVPDVVNAGTPQEIDPSTLTLTSKGSNYPASVGAVGSMGLMYSRFANRAPEFWHKKNQLARGSVGNGIPRWFNRVKQELDFATSTYDQVSRITRYERDRQLGLDQTPYVTPARIQLRTSMFAKDANGNLVCAIQPGDHVTLDNTLNYPYAGEYEVLEPLTVYPPTVRPSGTENGIALTPDASSGEIEFSLGPYNEAVMYDTSDDLEAGWPSVPGSDSGNESDYIGIPLQDGVLAIFMGALASGKTFQLPATGFNPANTLAWAGPAGYKEAGHPMHVIGLCDVDANFKLTLNYEDGSGNTWNGDVNFACIAWRSVATPTVSGAWTWIELTLATGEVITFGKAIVPDGATIPLPAGYAAAQSFAVAFPHDGVPNGNDAHGVAAYVDSNQVVHLNYQDGESHVWHGNASVLVFAWKNNMGTVTTETNGGATWVLFPVATAAPAAEAFKIGFARLNNGAALPTEGGDETAYLQAITSPSSFQIVDHPAHGVGACYLDSNDNVVMTFDDGEGNLWTGGADVFAALPVTIVTVQPVMPPTTPRPPSSVAPQIVLDPNFLEGSAHWSYGAGWTAGTFINGGATLKDATAASQVKTLDKFSVSPGNNYVLSALLTGYDLTDSAAGSGFCFLQFYDGNDAPIGNPVKGSVVSAAMAQQVQYPSGDISGGFTSTIQGAIAPAGAVYCLAGVEVDPPATGESTGSWTAQYVNGSQADLTNAAGLGYTDGVSVQSLRPAQAGADVTAQNTAQNTQNVGNQTAETVAAGATGVLLQNPNFAAGEVGWNLPSDAEIVATDTGDGYTVALALTNTNDTSQYTKPPCMKPDCDPGGVDRAAATSYVISDITNPPAGVTDTKMVTMTVTTNPTSTQTNVLYVNNYGTNDDVTKIVRDFWFRVHTPMGSSYEFDQQVFDKTRASQQVWSLQVKANGQWQHGDVSGWVNMPANVPLIPPVPDQWMHVVYTGHRSLDDTSAPGGVPWVYFDTLEIDGVAYDLTGVKRSSLALPANWDGILADQNQVDVGPTSGTPATVTCDYTQNNITFYTGAPSSGGAIGNQGNLLSCDFDSGTSGLTATGSPAIDSSDFYTSPNSAHFPPGVNCYRNTTDFAAQTTLYTRQYLKVNTQGSGATTVLALYNGSTELANIYLGSNGNLTLYNQITKSSTVLSSTPFPVGSWHYLEMEWTQDPAAGTVTVKLDGVTIYSGTGLNTGTLGATAIKFGQVDGGTGWDTNQDNVDVSNTGWLGAVTLGNGIPDAATGDSGYVLAVTGNGVVPNAQKIPCGPGAVLSAQAFIFGYTGTDGSADVSIGFYDVGANLLGSVFRSAAASASGAWKPVRAVTTAAPAGTAYAVISAEVRSRTTGTWYFSSFAAALQPATIDEVPDGSVYARPKKVYLQNGVPDTYMGDWSSATAYIPGEEVGYQGNYWSCLVANTNSAPTASNSNWILVGPASLDNVSDGSVYGRPKKVYLQNGVPDTYMGDWSSATAYIPGEEVGYAGNYWSCLVANTNSAPTASNSNWILVGPASLANVPDGGGRYAGIETFGDQTINHVQMVQGSFPSTNTSLPVGQQITLQGIALDISSTQDIVVIWVVIYPGTLGALELDIDGTIPLYTTPTDVGFAMAATTGLSAGSHTLYIRFTALDTAGTAQANEGRAMVLQICGQAGGLDRAPAGGRTILKPHFT